MLRELPRSEPFLAWKATTLILVPAGSEFLFQPKGNMTFGPWYDTEFYVSAGKGFHSDDIRGVLGTVPVQGVPPL